MITVDVPDYCQNCDGFEPVANRIEFYNFHGSFDSSDCVIKCANDRKCRQIARHIRKNLENSACTSTSTDEVITK